MRMIMRWHYDVHKLMKRSEKLFSPSLDMRWRFKGNACELWRDGVRIWRSIDGQDHWDQVDQYRMCRWLLGYLNAPIAALKQRRVETFISRWQLSDRPNYVKLISILLASDRRIGKNTLGIWLFMEIEPEAMRIIVKRL